MNTIEQWNPEEIDRAFMRRWRRMLVLVWQIWPLYILDQGLALCPAL